MEGWEGQYLALINHRSENMTWKCPPLVVRLTLLRHPCVVYRIGGLIRGRRCIKLFWKYFGHIWTWHIECFCQRDVFRSRITSEPCLCQCSHTPIDSLTRSASSWWDVESATKSWFVRQSNCCVLSSSVGAISPCRHQAVSASTRPVNQ